MKILFYNTEYCLGLNGSWKDYLLHLERYFFCPKEVQERALASIKNVINTHSSDLCCFAEIDRGSKISNRFNQIKKLTDQKYKYYDVETKYGQKSLLRKLPILSTQGNGFLSAKDFEFKKHYFKHGTKKLIYEIKIAPDTSVFLVHLALGKKMRAIQFKELKEIIKGRKKVIICGDFNIFGGFEEMDWLLKNTNLKIANQEKEHTYPSVNPKNTIDIFLCSKNIKIKNIKVIQNKASDHLPVMIEIE